MTANDMPPELELKELVAYFLGVYEATVMLKARIAKLGPNARPAARDVSRLQATAKRFYEDLKKTLDAVAESTT
jgi:hypothetical protein